MCDKVVKKARTSPGKTQPPVLYILVSSSLVAGSEERRFAITVTDR
jgi:hypothetical protein